MEWVETTGRTVAEAKDAALDQLGVDDADAEFVVVNEPRPGLFGRMRGEARVRARVRPTSPRPKRGRSRRPATEQRRGGAGTRSGGGRGVSRTTTTATAASAEVEPSLVERPPTGNGSGGGSAHRHRRGSRGGRGRGRSSAPTTGRSNNGAGDAVAGSGPGEEPRRSGSRPEGRDAGKETSVAEVLSLEEQGESARVFVEGLVAELGLDAAVSTRVLDEETVEVSVEGPELGLLVGRGGATLAALQELARTVVQSRTDGPTDRILVDVAGYRAKRAEALQRFTRQIADEVLASGSERALEPMLAADRKVVHDTVAEIEGVVSRSEGEDPYRYVVVALEG